MSQEEPETPSGARPELPTGRVKKLMKLDREINKITSEAIFLVTASTQLFLQFLAERSAEAALEKKRRTVKVEHIRAAVKRHRPTSDFLLDSLPVPDQSIDKTAADKMRARGGNEKAVGTKRIDSFFAKKADEDK